MEGNKTISWSALHFFIFKDISAIQLLAWQYPRSLTLVCWPFMINTEPKSKVYKNKTGPMYIEFIMQLLLNAIPYIRYSSISFPSHLISFLYSPFPSSSLDLILSLTLSFHLPPSLPIAVSLQTSPWPSLRLSGVHNGVAARRGLTHRNRKHSQISPKIIWHRSNQGQGYLIELLSFPTTRSNLIPCHLTAILVYEFHAAHTLHVF